MQNQIPYDEETLEEHTRRLVRGISILPVMNGGTRLLDFVDIDSQLSSVSALSFSSESSDSDSTMLEEVLRGEPIVELPPTPPREVTDVKRRFISLNQTLTPETIGEALERSGTVLMQRSRENRLAKQLEEMRALMENEDEFVVLKQPSSIRPQPSQPAFDRKTIRGFLEHSETMFHLAHDTQGSSAAQKLIDTEEQTDPSPLDVVVVESDRKDAGRRPVNEFVGCFSKDNDAVLYKKTLTEQQGNEQSGKRRESIDTLITQHAQCLLEADEVKQPVVQICQRNDENLLALLTFSDQSSAVLKTSSRTLEQVNSFDDLNQTLLKTYRQLLTRPDEMISMQTQRTAADAGQTNASSTASLHKHTPRVGLLKQSSSFVGTTGGSFGLSNDSRSRLALQGSSKNWTQCPRGGNAADIITNLRLLLEEFILRGGCQASAVVLQFVARLFADILQGPSEPEIDEEFRCASLIAKIKRIVDELQMPHSLEDPRRMVHQWKLTVQEILAYRPKCYTIVDASEAWATILRTSERLVCEMDHELEQPDVFLEALQCGLRMVLGTVDLDELEKLKQNVSAYPSSNRFVDPVKGNRPSWAVQCNCFTSWALLFVSTSLCWVKELIVSFWKFLSPTITTGLPSISFRKTVTEDDTVVQELCVKQDHLNETVDVLRLVLEKHPADPSSVCRSVNVRSLELFAQLLSRAGSIELRQSDSRHNIHLQLQDGITGDLVKRQSDQLLTLAGSIRDHDGNVAVVFDARMSDLNSLNEHESVMEYVTHVERLSGDDEEDEDEEQQQLEEVDEGHHIACTIIDEMISTDRQQQLPSHELDYQPIVNALVGEITHLLRDMLEPVESAVRNIHERMLEQDAGRQQADSDHLRTHGKSTMTEDVTEANEHVVRSESPANELLHEMMSLVHATTDRLALIDSDISAIRNELQQLLAMQLHEKSRKSNFGDGHQSSSRRPSEKRSRKRKLHSCQEEKDIVQRDDRCCPFQQKQTFSPSAGYCPLEIHSCHGVAPNILLLHWIVDEDLVGCIVGYEIHVDGLLRSVCFSNKRRTALIANVDLRQQHQIALHAKPASQCREEVKWAPALFLYHL